MEKGGKKKLVGQIVVVLAVLAFVFLAPGAVYDWYKIGTGLSYHKQLKAAGRSSQQSRKTADHELRVNKAKKEGVIYAALMVNGFHLPLLGLILATTGIMIQFRSQKMRRYLKIAFPLVCLWGIVCSVVAHRMISIYPMPFLDALMGASLIWLVIAVFFGIIILIAALVGRFVHRPKRDAA